MKEMNTFQLALMGIFGLFLIVGVLAFAGILPGFSNSSDTKNTFQGDISIWGTLPQIEVRSVFEEFNTNNKETVTVNYTEKSKNTFDQELIEALAEGRGPDVILLSQDLILRHRNKLYPIPYEMFPEQTFRSTYTEEGELYLGPAGIYGVPFIVDPIVMYWNRDIFSSAFVSAPPVYWDEFYTMAKKMTKIDSAQTIKQSFVSFGEYDNVANAKDILSLLILQAGTPIVSEKSGQLLSVFSESFGYDTPPADSAFRYFTEFSNTTKTSYSWNRSLPYSRDMFAMGNLALYFGYASEYDALKKKNPHLNFDVAVVPQAKDIPRKLTFGKMQALSILKSSKNTQGSVSAVRLLTGGSVVASVTSALSLPPVRRDLLGRKPQESHLSVFYDSALISKGWLDPSPSETNEIFYEIIRDISSERKKISVAVQNGHTQMMKLLRQYNNQQ